MDSACRENNININISRDKININLFSVCVGEIHWTEVKTSLPGYRFFQFIALLMVIKNVNSISLQSN